MFFDPYGKGPLKVSLDLFKLSVKYKSIPDAVRTYTNLLMYKKDSGNIYDYLPVSEWETLRKKCYWPSGRRDPILFDKIEFSKYMRLNKIPVAHYLGKVEKGSLYDAKDTLIGLVNPDTLGKYFGQLLIEKPDFFIKKIDSNQGQDVYKIHKNNMRRIVNNLNLNSNYIIEETIFQHEKLSKINPDCLNTLRVITFKKGESIQILGCIFKMGVKGIHADNGNAGGIFARYYIYDNKIDEHAFTHFSMGGKSFLEHPDTGFVFKDEVLPYPAKVIELVTNASKLIESSIVGWDVGFSPEGPILVEGNDDSSIVFNQISMKGLFSNELSREAFKR